MRSRERPRVSFKGHNEGGNRYYYLPVSLAQACIHMISGATVTCAGSEALLEI